MVENKWCESWEKNLDSSFKVVGKFKDDLKQKPTNLSDKTQYRYRTYIELMIMEFEEMKEQFSSEY